MEAKTYREVLDEYSAFKQENPDDPTTFEQFPKQLDELQGTPGLRSQAYNPSWIKRVDAGIDTGFRATHLPQAAGWAVGGLGKGFDALTGTHIAPVVEKIGEDTPRMLVESLLTIPAAASVAGAPVAAATWANRIRKVIGYGSLAAKGYTQTDSPVGAAISAGSMYGMNKYIPKVEGAAVNAIRSKLGIEVPQVAAETGFNLAAPKPEMASLPASDILARLGGVGAAAGTIGGGNELTRQAMMSVGPNAVGLTDPARNPLTQENIAGNVAGMLPFAPQVVKASMRHFVEPRQVGQIHEWMQNRETVEKQYVSATDEQRVAYHKVTEPSGYEAWSKGVDDAELGGKNLATTIDDSANPTGTSIDITIGKKSKHFTSGQAATNFVSAIDIKSSQQRPSESVSGEYTPSPEMKIAPTDYANYRSALAGTLLHAAQAEKEGNTPIATEFRRVASSWMDYLSGKTDVKPEETSAQLTPKLDELRSAQQQPAPEGVKDFAKLVTDLNHVVPLVNEQITAANSANEMSPSSVLVNQLQGKGLIEPITSDWLGKTFQEKVSSGMDEQLAYEATVQAAKSKVLDAVPDAVQKRGEMGAETPTEKSSGVVKADAVEDQFMRNLLEFPQDIQNSLIDRTLQIRSQGGKVNQLGRFTDQNSAWRLAVIHANQTFDPTTRTVEVYKGKNNFQRVKVGELFAKNDAGEYSWRPNASPIPVGEGGQGTYKDASGKTIVQANVEGLAKAPEGPVTPDENVAMQQLGEGTTDLGHPSTQIGQAEDVGAIVAEPNVDVAIDQPTTLATSKDLIAQKELLQTNLDQLSPDQLWQIMEPTYGRLQTASRSTKKAGAKLAIEAAFENLEAGKGAGVGPKGKEFVDFMHKEGHQGSGVSDRDVLQKMLKTFFGNSTAMEGKQAGVENYMARIGSITKRVLDPQVMGIVKGGSQARPGDDLVSFAAPVRLRRWLQSPSMGFTPDALGRIPVGKVEPLLAKLGVTKDEMSLYKGFGLDAFLLRQKVGVEELAKWLDEKTPTVEVKKLEPWGGVSSKYAEAQHYLEGQGFHVDDKRNILPPATYGNKPIESAGDRTRKLYGDRVGDAINTIFSEPLSAFEAGGDAATGKYGVEPKDLSNMPGAVDILVRLPITEEGKAANIERVKAGQNPKSQVLYHGPHFGDSDRNVLASIRGYVETLPTGEKVFHVFEVQSDWGQTVAKAEAFKQSSPAYEHSVYASKDKKIFDNAHPLLSVYEQLALKAAIKHARELGISKVAISDAETAMMTEGHDRYTENTENTRRISQEPGMRAAYDQRLPQTMEKLVGGKGEVVDFGAHKAQIDTQVPSVFKNPDGTSKTNVTARLYDISKAPDVFSAFGYAKPREGVVEPGIRDQFVNSPQGDTFSQDAYVAVTSKINQVLGASGYSGTMRDLYTNMGATIARQLEGVPVDFYKVLDPREGGLAFFDKGRGKIGLRLNEDVPASFNESVKYVNRILDTLSHEISHVDNYVRLGFIKAPDAYSKDRLRSLNELYALSDVLTPDQRHIMLTTLEEGLVPERFRQPLMEPESPGMHYGSLKTEEFTAEITRLVTRALLGTPKELKNAWEVLDYSPSEISQFARGNFRTIGDTLGALRETLEDPNIRAARGMTLPGMGSQDSTAMSNMLGSIVAAAHQSSKLRFADEQRTLAQNWVAQMSPGMAMGDSLRVTDATWLRLTDDITSKSDFGTNQPDAMHLPSAVAAIETARQAILPDRTQGAKFSIMDSWVKPFAHAMFSQEQQGNPIARKIAVAALDVVGATHRAYTSILRPIMTANKDGSFSYNDAHPMAEMIHKDKNGPWRTKGVNVTAKWQQEHGDPRNTKVAEMSLFVRNAKGELVTNGPDAQKAWDVIRRQIPLEKQQYVMAAQEAMDKINQNGRDSLLAGINQSTIGSVAKVLMNTDKALQHEVARQKAEVIVNAYLTGKVQSLVGTIPEQQIKWFDNLLVGKKQADGTSDGLISKYNEIAARMDARPGHNSESLPWDWIVRYRNQEGKVRYLSAQSEKRGYYLADQLREQGMQIEGDVVSKKDLRKFTDFDDPDALLHKFSTIESDTYGRFVTDMEMQYGMDLGNQLREGYVPAGAAIKEMADQSLGKYTHERKSQIDRERFDYIDGTMAWAGRLASSLAQKAVRQQKDLMLLDPRVRGDLKFQKFVNAHFDEMAQPTSAVARELKTVTAGYMMAGSIASALVEAGQSFQTVIPMWIATNKSGGALKAYKQLFSAVGDASRVTLSKTWQADAQAALRRDPKTWTKTDVSNVMYARHVGDGGITHGVMEEAFNAGRDQQMVVMSKFGTGDYGPMGVKEMLTPAYMGLQFLMKLRTSVSKFNDKIAFLGAVAQGFDQGMRGQELYDHAIFSKALTTFGGGKANAPGFLAKVSTEHTRSALAVANTLQQYGYGALSTMTQLFHDSIGKSSLSPAEKWQARKAFATWAMTNTALCGVLGLPFAGAALAVMEKQFGIPANSALRTGLASLSDDKETGAVIAETALNGFANQAFGLDVSSRAEISNLFGTSSYRGFNLNDLVGPAGSLVSNAVQALGLFGQGEPMLAAKALVPNAFKNVITMADTKQKYGDRAFRDKSGNLLYSPTPSQAAAYMIGFRPRELSQKRLLQTDMSLVNRLATTQHTQQMSKLAQDLLRGDGSSTHRYALEQKISNPMTDMTDIMRQVQNRAVDMTTEKDVLAQGPSYNSAERQKVAESYGEGVVTRQSEISRLQLRSQLAAYLGDPKLMPDSGDITHAGMVDMLTQSGRPRSEALALVNFLKL